MKNIAIINSDYHSTIKRYYASWIFNNQERELNINAFFITNSSLMNKDHVLILSNKKEKIIRGIKHFFRSPKLAIKWFYNHRSLSVRERINHWCSYASLICFKPDILHVISSRNFDKYQSLPYFFPPKFIVSFRGTETAVCPHVEELGKDFLIRKYNKADKLHFISAFLKNEAIALGAPPEKCKIVYPGINDNFFKRKSPYISRNNNQKILLITTGRLVWQKGYIFMIKAMKILVEKGLPVIYQILGKGPDYDQLAFVRHQLALNDHIIFNGEQAKEEVKSNLERANIYIQPSISEGLCVSILEALSMELPVVATKVGGIPEIITTDLNGILVPVADSEALARAIEYLIINPSMAKNMGMNGRETVIKKFSMDRELSEWHEFYLKIAK